MDRLNDSNAERVSDIFARASDLTLASVQSNGSPHASTTNFAHKGLQLYMAIAIDSLKAHNLRHEARVAVTVNAPYRSWAEIQGVSLKARATMIADPAELGLAAALLLRKYAEFADIIADTSSLPWPGMLFVRLDPHSIALLDYSQGFGHTEYFSVA